MTLRVFVFVCLLVFLFFPRGVEIRVMGEGPPAHLSLATSPGEGVKRSSSGTWEQRMRQ